MTGRTVFLPIGVPDVPNAATLPTVVSSVETLAAYVKTWWPNPDTALVVAPANLAWTRGDVLAQLKRPLMALDESDTAVVYWAGHGQGGRGLHKLLLAGDDHLLASELAEWLLDSPAERVVLILDCCYAGTAARQMAANAAEIWEQSARDEHERRSVTVISVARDEQALEGAFVTAMTEVLEKGSPNGTTDGHSWTPDEKLVSAQELVAAVNAWFEQRGFEQQAIPVELRFVDAGRFLPTTATRRIAGEPEVDERSAARRDACRRFTAEGVPSPPAWTATALHAHRKLVDAAATSDPAKQHLREILKTLELVLAAEVLLHSLVKRAALTEPVLAAARRAAGTAAVGAPMRRLFDLLDEAATRKVRGKGTPEEMLVRFLAAVVQLTPAEADWKDRLIDWADPLGVESHVVNTIAAEVAEPPPERRLVIDARGERTPVGRIPSTMSAVRYDDGRPSDERRDVTVDPLSSEGLLKAIGTLVAEQAAPRADSIDVILPEHLMLLDVAAAPVSLGRYPTTIGEDFRVAGRFGTRLEADSTRWDELIHVCRALSSDGTPVRVVSTDEFEQGKALADALKVEAQIVVFSAHPGRDGEPIGALLDALDHSPIVLWPSDADGDWPGIESIVTDRWQEFPEGPTKARHACGSQPSDVLARLHLVWDDEQWLALARSITASTLGG